jgi:hypothetical protein
MLGWLKRQTALGFSEIPEPAATREVDRSDAVDRGPLPIGSARLADGQLAWSAGGLLDQGPDDGRQALIEAAAAALPCNAGQLIDQAGCSDSVGLSLLGQLASWGGLRVSAGSGDL